MAVYHGMDIGTAKPTAEERSGVPVHMIDLVEPSCDFTVSEFQAAARRVISGIEQKSGALFSSEGRDCTCGLSSTTSGYRGGGPRWWPSSRPGPRPGEELLHARLTELDPVAAGRIEPSNRRRLLRALEVTIGSGVPFSSYGPGLGTYPRSAFVQVGIPYDQPVHDEKVASRFASLVEAGFVDEVRGLARRPGGISRTARQAIGYRELLDHLENGTALDDAIEVRGAADASARPQAMVMVPARPPDRVARSFAGPARAASRSLGRSRPGRELARAGRIRARPGGRLTGWRGRSG